MENNEDISDDFMSDIEELESIVEVAFSDKQYKEVQGILQKTWDNGFQAGRSNTIMEE